MEFEKYYSKGGGGKARGRQIEGTASHRTCHLVSPGMTSWFLWDMQHAWMMCPCRQIRTIEWVGGELGRRRINMNKQGGQAD